jgi:hypothetical protein
MSTSTTTNYLAWLMLAAALIALGGVVFFASTIQEIRDTRIVSAQQLGAASLEASQAASLKSLVSDTADERSELDSIAAVDPSSLADGIMTAGKSAGITIDITDANSESSPSIGSLEPTSAFSFVASASGSFASVMYATELLETLPVPSSIGQIEFTASADSSGASSTKASWQMNAQLQVLTASSTAL